jgi:hypothetical protein
MKKKRMSVIGGVIALGVLALILSWPKPNPPKINELPPGEIITGGVLSEALRSGDDVTCTSTNKEAQNESGSGSILISKNRFRMEVQNKGADGNVSVSHIISDGKKAYIWTSLGRGLKIELDQLTATGAATSAESILESYAKISGQNEVNCTHWQLDETVFEVPKGIEFVDITENLLKYKK